MTRRAGVLMAAVLALAATVTTGGSSWAEAPSGEVSWVSAGDSYSSGEGVAGNRGACAQSRLAYGPLAGQLARRAGWDITAEAFTACTGHLIEDLFNQRPDNRNAALWDWGVEQGAPDKVDLLTFSFGGNDIGFADLLIDCLPLPDGVSFDDVVTDDTLDITGCDTPEQEINDRIAALLDPPRRDCEGGRQGSDADYDCDLLIDDLGDSDPDNDVRGTLVDFYVYLANEHLTERGHIVVVGYPNLFAPVGEWPGYVKIQCQGVSRGDTERLGRLAANLDNTMIQAVRAANEQLGRDRIHYLPRSIIYRGGSHELCGSGDDWLNGLDFDRGDGQFRRENAFHPNDAGHAATAEQLMGHLNDLSFDTTAVVADGNGIAGVALEGPAGTVTEDLTEAFGAPDDDTGWREIDCLPGEPARERVVRWEALSVTTTDDPLRSPEPFLSAWVLDAANGTAPDGLGVDPAIELGDNWSTLVGLGAVWDEFYSSWELDGLVGTLSTTTPDAGAEVAAFGGGSTGLLGC